MKNIIITIIILTQFCVAQPATKFVAVTFDDLPLNIASKVDNAEMRRVVTRLLQQIGTVSTPATAFVNEDKLMVNGVRDPERVAILKLWLDAGIELGNHTYAHKSQNQVTIAEAKEDIVKGERTINELLGAHGKRPKYFRHPYLQTGRDSVTRATLTTFLDSLGYTIAPVTIDNGEWIFASAYDRAIAKSDTTLMNHIGKEYLSYMRSKARFFEWLSDTLFGRQIKQILLIHANRLNSDYYALLAGQFAKDGYTFCSVDDALTDAAYKSRNTFYGSGGISWLDRWALTRGYSGKFFSAEPGVSKEIMDLAGVKYE
jgi:peptidoglycan/xylan/chitin deacetylase (PgdA/CDA1 family)